MKKQDLSELMDDELRSDDASELVGRLGSDAQLVDQWRRYHLISDALSNHLTPYVGPELPDRVQQALVREPGHLFGVRQQWQRLGHATAGFALAASLVGVVVVGGQRLSEEGSFDAGPAVATIASNPARPTSRGVEEIQEAGMRWQRVAPEFETRLNGFLVSHSAYSDRMSPVRPYARVVSYHGAR